MKIRGMSDMIGHLWGYKYKPVDITIVTRSRREEGGGRRKEGGERREFGGGRRKRLS